MHPEALRGVAWAVRESGLRAGPDQHAEAALNKPLRCIDVGGADVNGSARRVVDSGTRRCNTWIGVDIEEGPGVDHVMDCRKPPPDDMRESFDLVLCTEVFEHVQDWSSIVITIHELLVPGGVALMTCASMGRRPHGARGALNPEPGEWYQNVPAPDLSHVLSTAGFAGGYVRYNPTPGDAYAWARKAS